MEYKNIEPMTNPVKALLKLVGEYGDCTTRKLVIHEEGSPFIQVDHYGREDNWLDVTYYSLAPALARQLLIEGFVTPMQGDKKEFKISNKGREFLDPSRSGT